MSHLKVVGGTEFAGADNENCPLPVEEAIKDCDSKSSESLRELARGLIRGIAVEGSKTVGDLLDEMNGYLRVDLPLGEEADRYLRRNAEIREKLRTVGVWTINAEPHQELSVSVFGCTGDVTKMTRRLPVLKQCEAALSQLTF